MDMRKVKILWGEDELIHYEAYSASVALFLEGKGIDAELTHVLNGAEMIGHLATGMFDLLVTDLDMKRFDGLTAIDRINERWPGLPIVVISGHTTELESDLKLHVRSGTIRSYCAADRPQKYCEAIFDAIIRHAPKILHISDLHFGKFHAFEKGVLSKLLKRHISEIRRDGEIDLVIVSGDLASIGEDDEFEEAKAFLTEFGRYLNVGLDRFVVIPGNHDIVRTARADSRFSNYVEFLISFYGQLEDPGDAFRHYPTLYDISKRIIRSDARRKRPEELYTFAVFDSLRTVAVGLNSVVIEDDFDFGRIEKAQLLAIAEEISGLTAPRSNYLRIATFHHNVMPIPNIHNDGFPERVVRNATLVLHHLMECGFDLIFHGHSHASIAYPYEPSFLAPDSPTVNPVGIISTGTLSASDHDPGQSYYHLNTIQCMSNTDGFVTGVVIQPHRLWDNNLSWRLGQPVKLRLKKNVRVRKATGASSKALRNSGNA